jgi:hypothetical protein
MRFVRVKTPAVRSLGSAPAKSEPANDNAGHESRALVPVSAAEGPSRRPAAAYRPAEFVAHLLAVRDKAPQAREHRRAEPAEAHAAYRAASRLLDAS